MNAASRESKPGVGRRRWLGRFVGFGCGLSILVGGSLIFLAKPLALIFLDKVFFDRFRDQISLSVEPVGEVTAGQVFTLAVR